MLHSLGGLTGDWVIGGTGRSADPWDTGPPFLVPRSNSTFQDWRWSPSLNVWAFFGFAGDAFLILRVLAEATPLVGC